MIRKSLLVLLAASLCGMIILVAGCGEMSDETVNPAGPTAEKARTLMEPELSDTLKLDVQSETGKSKGERPELAAGMPWWWYINLNIWGRAMKDVGKVTGLDCKPWASQVVQDVTGFALPSTQSNWIYLNSGHSYMIVDGNRVGGGTIEYGIGFGNIIQMHIYYKNPNTGVVTSLPHTAIFYEYVPGGMNWIDCNFVARGKVGVHFISWDWFRSRVGTRYSIYQAQNW